MSSHSAKAARVRFIEMISRDDDQINLAEAALLIAAEEYPRLNIEAYLDKLDHFGDLAREQAADSRDALDLIPALNSILYERLGFRGNTENYYDPRNSFLNEVIDRRVGIPITLAVVYIEVARRIGFHVKGVGLPFHFIAKHEAEGADIFIDPFNRGRLLGAAGCADLVAEMGNGKIELRQEHLAPVAPKQILTRLLSNLLGIYATSNHRKALATVERILLMDPGSPPHIRDRGLLLASVGDNANAIVELQRYLAIAPTAPDLDRVREQIKSIRQTQARLN